MSENELRRLLSRRESQFLERKSCYECDGSGGRWRGRKAQEVVRDIAEALAGFAVRPQHNLNSIERSVPVHGGSWCVKSRLTTKQGDREGSTSDWTYASIR